MAGIIYCLSRKSTEELTYKLTKAGYTARAYHAGLPSAERTASQRAFQQDDVQIICATIAFGMGIDKGNIRRVIHYNLPKNIESYYQEIGRSGRDGSPADCLLFYSISDVIMHKKMIMDEPSDIQACKLAKLDRLQQFCETRHCRMQMLLHYFGETTDRTCKICDACKMPSPEIDGTIIAQKTFSAIKRLEDISPHIGLVADFLR